MWYFTFHVSSEIVLDEREVRNGTVSYVKLLKGWLPCKNTNKLMWYNILTKYNIKDICGVYYKCSYVIDEKWKEDPYAWECAVMSALPSRVQVEVQQPWGLLSSKAAYNKISDRRLINSKNQYFNNWHQKIFSVLQNSDLKQLKLWINIFYTQNPDYPKPKQNYPCSSLLNSTVLLRGQEAESGYGTY